MIYQHPLAYLLGLEGVALLRAFAGEHGREFVEERFEQIRRLVSSDGFGEGTSIPPISAAEGYRRWVGSYDEPGNGLIDVEQPIVRGILDDIPIGVALDAACGTGRHTEYLVSLGHRVIAVDSSPEMLARAETRAPSAECHEADLHDLPVPDDHVDVVVCALALTHVPDLSAAFAELTRVLRPGGHLIISDAHGLAAGIRPPIVMIDENGAPGYMPHTNRLPGDYLRAAFALGLRVLRCEEPRIPLWARDDFDVQLSVDEMLPEGPPNIWLLHYWDPAASSAVYRDIPAALIWHFQLEE